MPPVNPPAAARAWPARLPAAIVLTAMMASCNTTTTYTPSTAVSPASSGTATETASAAASEPTTTIVPETREARSIQREQSPVESTRPVAQAPAGRSTGTVAAPSVEEQQLASRQQAPRQPDQLQQEQLRRQEDQRRQDLQRQQEDEQRRQQAQQQQQQEEAQRRQARVQQQEQQRLQAQLQANQTRLAELEREIESSRASAAAEARANAKLIEAIAAAEELLAALDAEQAKYTQVDENGQLQEPLQKSRIEELEVRRKSLLEEVRTLSATIAQ